MNQFFRQMMRRRRLFNVLIFGGVVFLFTKFHVLCKHSQYVLCVEPWSGAATVELFRIIRPYLAALIVLVACLLFFKRASKRALALEGGFKAFPEQFDGEVVELKGTVVRVLDDSVGEHLKRGMTDMYRTWTKDPNNANRHIHQRFFVESPDLKNGESIFVHHNTKFGKVTLSRGTKVHVKGEYAHRVGSRRGWFGRRKTYYGRVHFTHPPKGFLELL